MSDRFTGEVVSVSELIERARDALDDQVGRIAVEGEVFEYRGPHRSGHYYFKLRDGDSTIDVKMWRGVANRGMHCSLQEGRAVLGLGRLDIWSRNGALSFLLDEVRDLGAGNLAQRFEEMKLRLRNEGLFDDARKRAVPVRPLSIALITAIPSAAAADIEQTWREMAPAFQVQRIATRVQGAGAEVDIEAAIRAAADRGAEVVLLARGGGSLEDLWAFNEERTVRAIVASPIPVVVAVGHESDTTLADLAADLRCKTPTAGAVHLAHGWSHARQQLALQGTRLLHAMQAQQQDWRTELSGAGQAVSRARQQVTRNAQQAVSRGRLALRAQRPDRRLARARQAVHEYELRIEHVITDLTRRAEASLRARGTRLQALAMQQRLGALAARLQAAGRQIQAASPQALLERGYAMVRVTGDGSFLRDTHDLKVGAQLDVQVARGRFCAEVLQVEAPEKLTDTGADLRQ